ncbi:MAG: ABC transporter ATP-binding protein [Tenericutes bacterium GWC2_34_14]|nr:MAG: ABC transporter ATP-binding protein [Tenericutes bacterium GWA2_35_7]OHE28570.1 MAG: ABC transporter ATP-binding protein [Tenericutes bacterium GWC2_34_14]OHE33522.1 MAG: ABC transporter ATP-binding protein [Tenericutes bacterium GWE2_34_108]OHE36807.1 MAG: ABC transporter ATP-binding protein [Tenericutes bacterium GWF1_35_14]OHE38113.1 MAG: ABC transporter ATP-binding protein [Tenericutes bacterium GWF2_35_184]OHE42135.1 MAG: ABC transporter ATP-binding protein [Tenericutes bacterium 
MSMIKIYNATKNYGENKGIFNLSFNVEKGEVFGLLGPNGAGKTTTIRHLLGFSKLDSGIMYIDNEETWTESAKVQDKLGYLPGEISFPENLTGMEFIEYIGQLRGMKSFDKAKRLLEYFDLNASAKLKRMSKGMKQKIALVVAFMHDPQIVILDEPTSGLDPLMQERFIQLIAQEKKNGKTILLSSHMFNEIERTCDKVAIIKQGRLITEISMKSIRQHSKKIYEIGFNKTEELEKFTEFDFRIEMLNLEKQKIKIEINDTNINQLISKLSLMDIKYIKEDVYTLEKHFMQYYGKEV